MDGAAPAISMGGSGPVEVSYTESATLPASAAPDPGAAATAPVSIRLIGRESDELSPQEREQVLEALLFASDGPVPLARLAEIVGTRNGNTVRLDLERLNQKYVDARLSFRIENIAGGYQMMTLAAFKPWLEKLARQRSESRLSDAALEALSVVAYRQPVTRADIEAIRGVACGEVLNRLRELGLVRMAGRAEVVGRPILYATTRKFLDMFGLASLDDLPPMEALVLRRAPRDAQE